MKAEEIRKLSIDKQYHKIMNLIDQHIDSVFVGPKKRK